MIDYNSDYMRHEKQLQDPEIPARIVWDIVFGVIAIMVILFFVAKIAPGL